MSWPKRNSRPAVRRLRGVMLAASIGALAGLSACAVQPLYGQAPAAAGAQAGAQAILSSIAVKPAVTRFEQEVRNHLIFLFSGGAGEPANPLYSLQLLVISTTQAAASVQRADEDEPTAGTVTLAATYQLTRTGTGEVVGSGARQVIAPFDDPRQLFAASRAERDAQNRAARELAELLRLAIAQNLPASASQ